MFFLGTVTIYQPATIKNDGSGTLNLTYSSKMIDVKKNSYSIGNLPFSQKGVKEAFETENNKVAKVIIYKDKTDTSINKVTLTINFKDVNKIAAAKGFSGINTSFVKTDSGTVFRWVVTGDYVKNNQIDKYTYIFTFDDKIKSTNGVAKDNSVTWFRDFEKNPFARDIDMFVRFGSGEGESSGNEGKSCGLFGFELPVLLLGGMGFAYNQRKRKNKR